ncbi:MAG: tetratricopeptide repeat protein [Flavobacteriaceae bacterium]
MALLLVQLSFGQESEPEIEVEESAEVFLEAYSDSFQESFFEGLKQKGIENYDRAIALFLDCKRQQPQNSVVDHELAKAYLLDGQLTRGRTYALDAVLSEPENRWYLETLEYILNKQGSTVTSETALVPYQNKTLRVNLAKIYMGRKKYTQALSTLNGIKGTEIRTMVKKIEDSIQAQKKEASRNTVTPTKNPQNKIVSDKAPWEKLRDDIEVLIASGDIKSLKTRAKEALEAYPSQPYFYYAQGYIKNKEQSYTEAIALLETALDYLFDDSGLELAVYRQLADAHLALNETEKANKYLKRIGQGN